MLAVTNEHGIKICTKINRIQEILQTAIKHIDQENKNPYLNKTRIFKRISNQFKIIKKCHRKMIIMKMVIIQRHVRLINIRTVYNTNAVKRFRIGSQVLQVLH